MKPKTCSKCHKEKLLSDFYKNCKSKDGHLGQCKICHNKVQKKIRRERVPFPMGYPRYRKYHPELVKKALQWFRDGFSLQVIEAEFGIPIGTMKNYTSGVSGVGTLDRGIMTDRP